MNYRQLSQLLLRLNPDQLDMEVTVQIGDGFFPVYAALICHVDGDVIPKDQPFLVVEPETKP